MEHLIPKEDTHAPQPPPPFLSLPWGTATRCLRRWLPYGCGSPSELLGPRTDGGSARSESPQPSGQGHAGHGAVPTSVHGRRPGSAFSAPWAGVSRVLQAQQSRVSVPCSAESCPALEDQTVSRRRLSLAPCRGETHRGQQRCRPRNVARGPAAHASLGFRAPGRSAHDEGGGHRPREGR